MISTKNYILTILSLLFILSSQQKANSQDRSLIDSLTQVLKKSKEDTNKVIALDKLAVEYYKINLDTFKMFAEEALKKATKISYKEGMAKAYNKIAIAYFECRDYEQAVKYYNEQFKISKELGDKLSMAKYYRNIGLIYREQENFDKSIELFKESIKLREEIGDKLGIGSCYNDIGSLYRCLGSYESAIEYHNK